MFAAMGMVANRMLFNEFEKYQEIGLKLTGAVARATEILNEITKES
jgi:hypothetical protein